MANPGSPSNYGHHSSASFRLWDLSRIRGVISVLIDIGRLIDRGMAMWLALGLPLWRHA